MAIRRRCGVRLPVLVILLVGAWLRFHALTLDARFHPDEALFSTFARSAAVYGDWMFSGPLDKSPLSLYAAGVSMHFLAAHVTQQGVIDVPVQQGEFAARLPSTLAGVVSIALMIALARRLYDDRVAHWAGILLALSPLMIAYSASAFTDGLMLMFGLAAALAALTCRGGWSGVLLALSVWSKQQGGLFLPLVLLLFVSPPPNGRSDGCCWRTRAWRASAACVLVFGAGLLLLLAWDVLRGETSIFALAAVNNDPGRALSPATTWFPRLAEWVTQGRGMLSAPALTAGLIGVGMLAAAHFRSPADRVLLVYAGGYALLHWIGPFNTYARYLLPLTLVIALLGGRGVAALLASISSTARRSAATILLAGLLVQGVSAARTVYHANEEDPNGILALAAYINAKPLGAIVYDHWLGWQMGYYLGAWSDKRRVYYPDPQTQALDALHNPDPAPRYLIAPQQADVAPWISALQAAGFSVALEYAEAGFVSFMVLPPPASQDAAAFEAF